MGFRERYVLEEFMGLFGNSKKYHPYGHELVNQIGEIDVPTDPNIIIKNMKEHDAKWKELMNEINHRVENEKAIDTQLMADYIANHIHRKTNKLGLGKYMMDATGEEPTEYTRDAFGHNSALLHHYQLAAKNQKHDVEHYGRQIYDIFGKTYREDEQNEMNPEEFYQHPWMEHRVEMHPEKK
jgi:Ni,Fe-hydrogenase I large subunit